MVQELFGSHQLFATLNPWGLGVFLYAFIMLLVLLGRKIFEGRAYNVSWSSVVGGAALFACMAIAGQVLHRPYLMLPSWLLSITFHQIAAEAGIVIGICMGAVAIYQTTWVKSQWVDLAFNFLMVPAFFYLLGTLLPVIYFQGTADEEMATVVLLIVYGVTAIIDIVTGRLHQPEWLEAHPD